MNTSTDWTTATIVLAAGVIFGLLLIYRLRRAATTPKPHPILKGFVIGVASTLAVGFIAYYATRSKPQDVEPRIARAKALFAKNDLIGTLEQTSAVLAVNPDEPRALTYNAIVRMAMGQSREAQTMLEKATNNDPLLLDAWVALASARAQTGDHDGAAAAIDAAIARHPKDAERLRGLLTKMEPAVAEASSQSLPPNHPTMSQPLAPPSAEPVHVTLSLEGAAKNGVIYVIARGNSGGHPVAVKRIQASTFPLTFDFGGTDTMMGASLPQHFHLEARLDSDGDAGTNDASDPQASADVTAGANVSLTLKERS